MYGLWITCKRICVSFLALCTILWNHEFTKSQKQSFTKVVQLVFGIFSPNSWIHKIPNSRILDVFGIVEHKFTNSRGYKFTNSRIHVFMRSKEHKFSSMDNNILVWIICFCVCLFWNFNPSKAWNFNPSKAWNQLFVIVFRRVEISSFRRVEIKRKSRWFKLTSWKFNFIYKESSVCSKQAKQEEKEKEKKKKMKNSSNGSEQAAMESKADSKGSLAYKGWRARGAWGGWSWALSFNSLLRFHELSYFLTVIVRHQLLHSIFLVQTYSALSKSQRTFICTKLFVTSNYQLNFTNLQIYLFIVFAWLKRRADCCGIFVL